MAFSFRKTIVLYTWNAVFVSQSDCFVYMKNAVFVLKTIFFAHMKNAVLVLKSDCVAHMKNAVLVLKNDCFVLRTYTSKMPFSFRKTTVLHTYMKNAVLALKNDIGLHTWTILDFALREPFSGFKYRLPQLNISIKKRYSPLPSVPRAPATVL